MSGSTIDAAMSISLGGSSAFFQSHAREGQSDVNRSSNNMPKEVRAAIAWCLSREGAGSLSAEDSGAYVEEMFEDGRGGEESW